MKKYLAIVLAVVICGGFVAKSAIARPPYLKAFTAKYVKEKPENDAEKALKEAVDKIKCNVCHEGNDKKKRNAYGKALDKLLDKEDAANADKINESLDKVAEEKINPDDEKSATYGDHLKEGKLPAGE